MQTLSIPVPLTIVHSQIGEPTVEAPEFIVFASYGNDSIALIQWLHEREVKGPIHVAHSDTGWAAPGWAKRVEEGEEYAQSLGYVTHQIPSIGMEALVKKRRAFPGPGAQFCTTELKIKPAYKLLGALDPNKEAICVVGVRREESAKRRTFPEWVEESDKHDGRSLWAPLVSITEGERNALVERAGFEVLPHRSMECAPCINANRTDLRALDEETVTRIERMERELSEQCGGKPRAMFRPHRYMGAKGIREIMRWAHSQRGRFEADPEGGCDSGWCGS